MGVASTMHWVCIRRFLQREHTGRAWSHLSFALRHGSQAACWPFLRRVGASEGSLEDLEFGVSGGVASIFDFYIGGLREMQIC